MDEYRAMLATLVCRIPTDDPEFTLTDMMTRWGLQNLTTGQPLTEGDGPTFIDVPPNGWRTERRRYVMPGTAGESSALWLTDDLDECIAKVRTFRGILHIGRNLTYDLTRWPHLSDHHPRGGACRRCGAVVKIFRSTGRLATEGENYDCPGLVWEPGPDDGS
jgi:hypothetical protein